MINKLVTTDSYDFGEASSSLVPLCRSGADSAWLTKRADAGSMFSDYLKDLKPQKDRTVLHLIALGDEEKYGPNRNCDSFSGEDNKTAHKTFKDLGKVYRNHKHSDPSKSIGDVLASGHNDQMGRVELIVALKNALCHKEAEAADRGEDIPFSMGSSQAFDVCSLCGNKAPTADKHCDCIKDHLGEVTKDGTKIYMKNPNPKYFDISVVHKPADRIAYSLRKVASASQVIGGHELAEMFGVEDSPQAKVATMHAIAELIKEIPLTARKLTAPKSVHADTIDELKKAASLHGFDQVLGYLNNNGFLLSPEDFSKLALDADCDCASDTGHGIDDIMEDVSEIPAFEEPMYQTQLKLSESAEHNLKYACSMDPEQAVRRSIIITIDPPKLIKAASDPVAAHGFSMLYKHYKVAFAHQNRDNPALVRTVAATF